MKKKLVCLSLALLLCLSVIGCSGGNSNAGNTGSAAPTDTTTEVEKEAPVDEPADTVEESVAAPSGDAVTLQVFSMPANTSGLQENSYWSDILERDAGVRIELLPSGDQGEQKLAALMAANAFPDVVVLKSYKHVVDAIAADLLVCLDDYPNELKDAFDNIPSAIQYFRDNVSNGTGKAYAFPNQVSTKSASVGDTDYGPQTRWDLYKEIGMPTIETFEDYLTVLQQMLEIYPTNEDGQKVYGMSLWSDWDGTAMQSAEDFMNFYGKARLEFVEVDYTDGSFTSLFDDDSLYRRWLKLLFTANQMGILDPDSISQRWNDVVDKQTAGRVLFSYWNWGYGSYNTPERTEQVIGFQPVYVQDTKMERGTGPQYVGGVWPYGIGKDTKYLDEALRFVNYMYSYDGVWSMIYGDQGEYWDIDDDGQPYKTEFGWQMDNDPTLKFANGGRQSDGINVINSYGLSNREIHPAYGVTIDHQGWVKKDFAPEDSNLVKDWKDTMQAYDGSIAYLKSKGMMIEKPFAPMEPYSDEIDQINQRIGDVCKTQSWLMVYAKDEAEFNSLWDAMAEKAKGMNLEASQEASMTIYNNASEMGSKYMK